MRALPIFSLAVLLPAGLAAQPDSPPAHWGPVSINLEDVPYPYPVSFLERSIMGQAVRIAYMDVAPAGRGNGRTVTLLHGGSYYGWYWADTIAALSGAGFRVVAIDRLGWGRSSKPILPYDAAMHSANTRAVLEHLGVERTAVAGHSLGGRMASHFAYTYPETATHLIMVNPIGLGAPERGRAWREPSSGETAPDPVRHYRRHLELERRRVVEWKPEFLEHVRVRYGWSLSGDFPRLNLVRALNGRLTAEPVRAFWPQIETPALLIGGTEDGPDYPAVAQAAADLLPEGELHLFPGIGHNPHLEAPELLNRELIRFLER